MGGSGDEGLDHGLGGSGGGGSYLCHGLGRKLCHGFLQQRDGEWKDPGQGKERNVKMVGSRAKAPGGRE